ncbi:MAG TPA: hypothetical protein VFA27_11640 [Vicinamibacterales bacterium]|nr:hypothetical protein [Vicinamibacterales bacterium]
MTDEYGDAALQRLWQSQPKETTMTPLDDLHDGALRFQQRIAWRNGREYAAGAIVIVMFGYAVATSPSPIIRVASALIIAATAFVSFYLHTHGAARRAALDALAAASVLEFARAELERQRDLLRRVWLWYELPFMPGLLLFQIGVAQQHPERGARGAVVIVAVAAATYALNRYAASRIQKRLDALPRPD